MIAIYCLQEMELTKARRWPIQFLCVFGLLGTVRTFSNGPGVDVLPDVCSTMLPGHGVEPQTTPPPYTMTVSTPSSVCFIQGQQVTSELSINYLTNHVYVNESLIVHIYVKFIL